MIDLIPADAADQKRLRSNPPPLKILQNPSDEYSGCRQIRADDDFREHMIGDAKFPAGVGEDTQTFQRKEHQAHYIDAH